MEVKAVAKNVRVSPQKANLVVKEIRKLKPSEALNVLDFVPKASAPIIKKVVASALANAKNNFGLKENSLIFKEISVGKGITFKRYNFISRGRPRPFLRRTANIRVVLENIEGKQEKEPKTLMTRSQSTVKVEVEKKPKERSMSGPKS